MSNFLKRLSFLFSSKKCIDELNESGKELDDKYNMHGRRSGNRIDYENGCYGIVSGRGDKERVALYTKGGERIQGEYEVDEIENWHHGFIMVRYHFTTHEFYYDCDGNMVLNGDGVFITDKDEVGENMYIVPVDGCTKYLLYNHKVRKFVEDPDHKGCYLYFNGIKGEGDKIIGSVIGRCDAKGYGTFNENVYYDIIYTLDRDGNILDKKKTNIRDEE